MLPSSVTRCTRSWPAEDARTESGQSERRSHVVNRSTGKWNLIADIGAFLKTHPAKYESADDFEPDGTLYSIIAVDGVLYTVEPNHGQVFSVTRWGDDPAGHRYLCLRGSHRADVDCALARRLLRRQSPICFPSILSGRAF